MKFIFNSGKRAAHNLYKADQKVRKFIAKCPKEMTKRQHKKLRKLLTRRAAAISKVLGKKVSTPF